MRKETRYPTLERITTDPSLGNDTIIELIQGNEAAFLKIFEFHHHALYRHVIRFVKSPDLASDIVQEVFIKLWENRSTVNIECSLKAYLFTIAKNHLLNVLKRAAKEESIKREIVSYAMHSHTSNEDSVIYSDLAGLAEKAIENLPPQRRLIFKMHKDEGKDNHQIAEALNISKNTVRDHLAKATKAIRSYLKVYADIASTFFFLLLF